MDLRLKTIPASEHRYATCGDYWGTGFCDGDEFEYRVTQMPDWRAEAAVFLHEFVESMLCKARGISENSITNFDIAFEGSGEPGDDPNAPYRKEHRFAENIERAFVHELGMVWADYEKVVNAACE
jgi:hypothetical protein